MIELYRLQNCTALDGTVTPIICAKTDLSCDKLDTTSFPRGCNRHALTSPHSLQSISWQVCIQNAVFHWKYPTAQTITYSSCEFHVFLIYSIQYLRQQIHVCRSSTEIQTVVQWFYYVPLRSLVSAEFSLSGLAYASVYAAS